MRCYVYNFFTESPHRCVLQHEGIVVLAPFEEGRERKTFAKCTVRSKVDGTPTVCLTVRGQVDGTPTVCLTAFAIGDTCCYYVHESIVVQNENKIVKTHKTQVKRPITPIVVDYGYTVERHYIAKLRLN